MRARVLAAVVLLLGVGAAGGADERPLDRTELDRRAVKVVYEIALLGTDVFNKGKHEECYRLYQGALVAVHPMLDHRPKLAAAVKEKLDKARILPAADAAFVLREALDEIQNTIAPGGKAADPKAEVKVEPKKTALWDRLGGEDGVKKVVHDFILQAAEDPKVNFFRGKKYDAKAIAAMEKSIVEMVSEVTGGPLKYSGKDMKAAHAGMKVTEEEFDAAVVLLTKSLDKFKVEKADVDAVLKLLGATKRDIVEGKGN